jgi:hypothetical protein
MCNKQVEQVAHFLEVGFQEFNAHLRMAASRPSIIAFDSALVPNMVREA